MLGLPNAISIQNRGMLKMTIGFSRMLAICSLIGPIWLAACSQTESDPAGSTDVNIPPSDQTGISGDASSGSAQETIKEIEAWMNTEGAASMQCTIRDAEQDLDLKQTLLEMGKRDQSVRQIGTQLSDDALMVDEENTRQLREIIEAHGWPDNCLVGPDGADAAFLVLQHTQDTEFRTYALAKFEEKLKLGTVDASNYAYLIDRDLMNEGLPQIYGTQYRCESGATHPVRWKVENEENLDALRRKVGLFPIRLQDDLASFESCD